MRLVQRRRLVRKAVSKGIASVQRRVQDSLQKWWRSLYPVVRDLKQIQKVDIPIDESHWQRMMDEFSKELESALVEALAELTATEIDFWSSRGVDLSFDYMDIIRQYQDRVGRKITQIAEDTRSRVQTEITEWFSTDQGLDELTTRLMSEFSAARAALIAQTELTSLSSQLTLEIMKQVNQDSWVWEDVEDNYVCPICSELHGKVFGPGDPTPPDASHPGCRCAMSIVNF